MAGGLWIDSVSQADRPGVYAIEQAAPRLVAGIQGKYIGIVARFAWGPAQTVVTPDSSAALIDMFEPAGSPRTSTGFRALMKRKKGRWKICRVLGATPVTATAAITGTGGTQTATGKYPGVLGNNITVTYSAATNGDAAKRNITVRLTDAVTGTTEEVYQNQSLPAANTAGSIDVTNSKLLASLTIASHAVPAWPSNGTTSLTGGTDGSAVVAADYTGTEGAPDKGLSLFELHNDVGVVVADDCGSSLRATVNTALSSHAKLKGNRMAVLQFDVDAAWASVKSAAAVSGLLNDYTVAYGNWGKVRDLSGTLQTSPFATAAATAMINLDPNRSHAQHGDEGADYFDMFEELQSPFDVEGAPGGEAFALGIALGIKRVKDAKIVTNHDRTLSQTKGKQFASRRRMATYLIESIRSSLTDYVNAPNSPLDNAEMKGLVDSFLKAEQRLDRIGAFGINVDSVNTPTSLSGGDFSMLLEVRTYAPRERIFLLAKVGETVTVQEAE